MSHHLQRTDWNHNSALFPEPTHATCPSHHNSIDLYHPQNIWKAAKIIKVPTIQIHQLPITSLHLGPNNPISTVFCNTCSLHPAYTHTTRPSLHQIHYNKNVPVTSYRRKVHTISVKCPADALAAEDTEMEEVERNVGMKTEIATSYNGGVTQSIPHCSICKLNCGQWWWACCIQCITGPPWNRVKFKITPVYHHNNELATSFSTK